MTERQRNLIDAEARRHRALAMVDPQWAEEHREVAEALELTLKEMRPCPPLLKLVIPSRFARRHLRTRRSSSARVDVTSAGRSAGM